MRDRDVVCRQGRGRAIYAPAMLQCNIRLRRRTTVWPCRNVRYMVVCATLALLLQVIDVLDETLPQPPDGSEPLVYDASTEKPLLPVFQTLSEETPAGYETDKLLGSLPPHSDAQLAFLTYGDVNSRAVACRRHATEPIHLFVDLDRNHHFGTQERLLEESSTSREWQVALDAEFVVASNQFEHATRRVKIRLNASTGKLELATLGCMRGQVLLEGRIVEVLRVDSNGNGLWFDPVDRFWIDINGDSRFDPFREKFACRTTCAIGDRRYAIASDRRGLEFRLSRIDGTGTLVPVSGLADTSVQVTECEAVLVSETGIHVFLQDADSSVTVPVGSYRLHLLQISLQDAHRHWRMMFASDSAAAPPRSKSGGTRRQASRWWVN